MQGTADIFFSYSPIYLDYIPFLLSACFLLAVSRFSYRSPAFTQPISGVGAVHANPNDGKQRSKTSRNDGNQRITTRCPPETRHL